MRRRGTFLTLLLAATAATAGCFPVQPDPPTLADPLVEVYRIPSPVPAPVAGRREWAYVDSENGIIAEGRTLASVDLETGSVRFAETLPEPYAATESNRPMASEDHIVLPGHGSSVLVISKWLGAKRWERELPGRGQLIVVGSGTEQALVHSRCDARGCDLTALLLESGKQLWKVRTPEPVTLTNAGSVCPCLFTQGRRTITQLSTADGHRLWSSPTPPGPTPVLKHSTYRLTVITPPAAPACRATLRGLEVGREAWKRDVVWQDPAGTGPCGFDPGRITEADRLFAPAPGQVTVIDEYEGTARLVTMRPGEQLVPGGLAWSPTAGYRRWRETPLDITVPAPADGRPWAQPAGRGWLLASGTGAVYYDPDRGPRRQIGGATTFVVHRDNRLIYQIGGQLVGLGPAQTS
ncbi:outer membrane protein assembly factor BamB family protein [Paractinoplanes maris]|uniref:outer membrane protein assembly factor BamB family protein n=1 Tax=Paractinoplanes maris TaxID=1734446 RepID=UPI0020203434|nr:PQQ-binding-like beta-propeller repeat protein [Actinoplanes maris]